MKKETWKTVFQIVISILTAIAASLGVTSCMSYNITITNKKCRQVKSCRHFSILISSTPGGHNFTLFKGTKELGTFVALSWNLSP